MTAAVPLCTKPSPRKHRPISSFPTTKPKTPTKIPQPVYAFVPPNAESAAKAKTESQKRKRALFPVPPDETVKVGIMHVY